MMMSVKVCMLLLLVSTTCHSKADAMKKRPRSSASEEPRNASESDQTDEDEPEEEPRSGIQCPPPTPEEPPLRFQRTLPPSTPGMSSTMPVASPTLLESDDDAHDEHETDDDEELPPGPVISLHVSPQIEAEMTAAVNIFASLPGEGDIVLSIESSAGSAGPATSLAQRLDEMDEMALDELALEGERLLFSGGAEGDGSLGPAEQPSVASSSGHPPTAPQTPPTAPRMPRTPPPQPSGRRSLTPPQDLDQLRRQLNEEEGYEGDFEEEYPGQWLDFCHAFLPGNVIRFQHPRASRAEPAASGQPSGGEEVGPAELGPAERDEQPSVTSSGEPERDEQPGGEVGPAGGGEVGC